MTTEVELCEPTNASQFLYKMNTDFWHHHHQQQAVAAAAAAAAQHPTIQHIHQLQPTLQQHHPQHVDTSASVSTASLQQAAVAAVAAANLMLNSAAITDQQQQHHQTMSTTTQSFSSVNNWRQSNITNSSQHLQPQSSESNQQPQQYAAAAAVVLHQQLQQQLLDHHQQQPVEAGSSTCSNNNVQTEKVTSAAAAAAAAAVLNMQMQQLQQHDSDKRHDNSSNKLLPAFQQQQSSNTGRNEEEDEDIEEDEPEPTDSDDIIDVKQRLRQLDDIKFTPEKLVTEFQQLSRSNSASTISERTLEECWSTLQRIFMHKSAMQIQHVRDLQQRNGSSVSNNHLQQNQSLQHNQHHHQQPLQEQPQLLHQAQQQQPNMNNLNSTTSNNSLLNVSGIVQSTVNLNQTTLQNQAHNGTATSNTTNTTEIKPHQCQQCLKSFSSNHQLVQHIRVHTGEKPYKCSYCDRRFKQLSHVQQHTRLHTGERPYKCHLPECGRAFIQLSNLQQHLRNHDAQVERAKNRPFHCNICGKGFATESSLRTHTSKELQLHFGVLQQHVALIGGPNATTCPICHKIFLGGDAVIDHMKQNHKEHHMTHQCIESTVAGNNTNTTNQVNVSAAAAVAAAALLHTTQNDSYIAKRRTANHPCPVCGKHYVNEGSLRKHMATHPETQQLANSLRMWPCSVCQAVFTHETGLLTHMEHMRMDPKHQFAAQIVLSRAAVEKRERDTLIAAAQAAVQVSNKAAVGLLNIKTDSYNPHSPDGQSDISSSDQNDPQTPEHHVITAGDCNIMHHINNNSSLTNNNVNCSNKMTNLVSNCHQSNYNDLIGINHQNHHLSLQHHTVHQHHHIEDKQHSEQPSQSIEPEVSNVSDSSDAVQAAVVNLAAAMRMQQTNGIHSSVQQICSNDVNHQHYKNTHQQNHVSQVTIQHQEIQSTTSTTNDQLHIPQLSNQKNIRNAESMLRNQAEVALRLAVSKAACVAATVVSSMSPSENEHVNTTISTDEHIQNSNNITTSNYNVLRMQLINEKDINSGNGRTSDNTQRTLQ